MIAQKIIFIIILNANFGISKTNFNFVVKLNLNIYSIKNLKANLQHELKRVARKTRIYIIILYNVTFSRNINWYLCAVAVYNTIYVYIILFMIYFWCKCKIPSTVN